MWYFCKYKDILGKPNTGLHSYRIFDISIIDVLLTLILAKIVQKYFLKRSNYWTVLVGTLISGVVFHRLFCVRTTIDKLLFS